MRGPQYVFKAYLKVFVLNNKKNMLYSPVLCNGIAKSSPEPSLMESPSIDLGSSSSMPAPIASACYRADVWARSQAKLCASIDTHSTTLPHPLLSTNII